MTETSFPQDQAPHLQNAYADGGVASLIGWVQGWPDDDGRRQLYSAATRTVKEVDGGSPNYDDLIRVYDAAMAEGLRQATTQSDPELVIKRTDYANAMSYNLAADLAECWPSDNGTRETRHFQRGLQAAEDCIRWRTELKKGPFPFSIAHWAEGAHALSLGDTARAITAFGQSADFARQAATANDQDPEAAFGTILGEGYQGIAEEAAGQPAARYDSAVARFQAQVATGEGEVKEDAQFGLDQLAAYRKNVLARLGK
ncbi:MAG: hypothetical protein ABI743_14505 [bacterium]